MYCPWCFGEVSAIGAGDECLDFCPDCDLVVEGETLFQWEVGNILEIDLLTALEDWDFLITSPEHTLKWKRDLHCAEESLRIAHDEYRGWLEVTDWRGDL